MALTEMGFAFASSLTRSRLPHAQSIKTKSLKYHNQETDRRTSGVVVFFREKIMDNTNLFCLLFFFCFSTSYLRELYIIELTRWKRKQKRSAIAAKYIYTEMLFFSFHFLFLQ